VPESLVLLHGFASTRRLWEAVIARLAPERYRPLALDLPGHGSNAAGERPVTFERCVREILAAAPERFALAGYSMGGRVALHGALAAPERVRRLVLISTTAGIEDERERMQRRERDRALALQIEHEPIERFIELWRSQPMFQLDPGSVDCLARAEMRLNSPAGVAAALRGIGTGEMLPLWERLAELAMPVTVIAGERDAKFLAAAERMGRLLPAAEVRVLAGGHVLPLENVSAVAAQIEAQL
jgi:2-succinyl-6-hydroxy-2,4-cyclohexadiene-1-carboxylate synthase